MSDSTPTTPSKGARIPLCEVQDMAPAQQAQYEQRPEARTNMFRLFCHAQTMAPHLAGLNIAMATSITVPPMEREVMTLAVLFLERGEYEIAQHRVVAEQMGISAEKLHAIAEEQYASSLFTERERALLYFTRQVVRSVRVDDPTFNAVAAFYNPRQIVETLLVITNYMSLLRLTEAVELPVDSLDGASFWKKPANNG